MHPAILSTLKLSPLSCIGVFLCSLSFPFLVEEVLAEEVPGEETLEYALRYHVTLQPDTDSAEVVIELDHDGLVKEIDLNLDPDVHFDIEANGELTLQDGRAIWVPPEEDARLSLNVHISHERNDGSYDALMTDDWAIFRGDDLVPPARVSSSPGAESRAQLSFTLPEHWTSVSTGWDKLDERSFRVENPERRFSRPTGWMIAGKLGTRREQLGDTEVAISAPRGSNLRRMDVLTFLTMVWPEVEAAFGKTPPKLAIIGHGNPMWRGGLSGPNSLFLHADRPLVSENGTSSLMHELSHVITRIRGAENSDWIAEGLAEFYSIELLYRAGAMTAERRQKVLQNLEQWSADVKTLIKPRSSGETTARAVLLFEALDQEIRERSDGEQSLDDVVRQLIDIRKVSLEDLNDIATEIAKGPLEALAQDVLKEK